MLNNESLFSKTENLEQNLISLLRDNGVEDFETKEALNKWLKNKESLIESADDIGLAKINFTLECARLYSKAGLRDLALQNFQQARLDAWQEDRNELYKQIISEMDAVKK